MSDRGIEQHPDLRDLKGSRDFALRAWWRRRRDRARMKKQWRSLDVQRRQRRKTTLRIAAFVLAPIAIVGAVTYVGNMSDRSDAKESIRRTPPSTTVATRVRDAAVQLHQPFVETPAATWKDGIAGIKSSKVKAIGDFSAKEVGAAIRAVKRTIEAAYLDRQVLEQHRFQRFLGTLSPRAREYIERRAKSVQDKAGYVVLIDRKYRLLPAVPKTRGTITVREGDPGELRFTAKVSIAYAFDTDDPGRLMDALDIVSVVKANLDLGFYTGPNWERAGHGVHLLESRGAVFSMNCDAAKKGLLAPYYSDRRWTNQPAKHDEEHYFDPAKPLTDENCT